MNGFGDRDTSHCMIPLWSDSIEPTNDILAYRELKVKHILQKFHIVF